MLGAFFPPSFCYLLLKKWRNKANIVKVVVQARLTFAPWCVFGSFRIAGVN